MTIERSLPRRQRRTDPRAGHTYRVPIVRELPRRPVDTPGEDTW